MDKFRQLYTLQNYPEQTYPWINFHQVQLEYDHTLAKTVTVVQGAYWEKRLSAAQRRYLGAVETLAKVRKLKLPAIQVNIGEKQVNFTG